jgi:hypothetical protein
MRSIVSFALGAFLVTATAAAVSACGSDSPSTTEEGRGPSPVGNVKPQPGGGCTGPCKIVNADQAEAVDASAK